jgi:hypothetical protein
LPTDILNIAERFWLKDLTEVDSIMKNSYSSFGPKPRTPSCMLRSYLLSLALNIPSYTKWVNMMRTVPIYAIISGFEFGNTPGVGTFVDFFKRLWKSKNANISCHLRPVNPKVKKPAKKFNKADSVEKFTLHELLKELQDNAPTTEQPYSLLFKVFKHEFLDESVKRKLVTPNALTLAGDGTPVYTAAYARSKRVCNCKENGITSCSCSRHYSQPDCDVGWDSSRGRFYNGYSLYILTDANSESDLPIFPLLQPASHHDAHNFPRCFFTMKAFLPDYNVEKLLLDSAHDAFSLYDYCRKNNITPFIDLNEKRGIKMKYKNDFTIGSDGVPRCQAGLRMRHDGIDRANHRCKFRCPLTNRKTGECYCEIPCSNSKFGRTVHLASKDNPRLFNIPPRDSEAWKKEYNGRTSSERCNKRIKVDFHLEDGRHRSSKMWYCRTYGIMMLQHLFAWDLPFASAFRIVLMKTG